MKFIVVFFCLLMFGALPIIGQTSAPVTSPAYNANDPLTMLANDVARTAKAVETLAMSWGEFTRTFSSNQGLRLDERQQKLILALEVMNRLEVSMASMQKLRHDQTEQQSGVRLKLATITDDLRPQSIEKYVALRGSTDAEGLRRVRRQTLERSIERSLSFTSRSPARSRAAMRRSGEPNSSFVGFEIKFSAKPSANSPICDLLANPPFLA